MSKIFDLDSPFMRVLNRVADLMILNFLMIICCIPIITIGAACTGMHYVLLKIVRGEEGYLVRGFFKSFKQNFRQATILWLIMLLVIAVYIGDFLIFTYSGVKFPTILVIAILGLALVLLMVEYDKKCFLHGGFKPAQNNNDGCTDGASDGNMVFLALCRYFCNYFRNFCAGIRVGLFVQRYF